MTADPVAEIVVAVHSGERRVDRAVRSVLTGTALPVRVTVVAHNITPEALHPAVQPLLEDPRVNVVMLHDGIPSPAQPMNHGLDIATAPWVGVLGSDDELEPGAVDGWVRLGEKIGAGAVAARVRRVGERPVPAPPVRPFRVRHLDPVKDRLAYRSAPLGLMSRAKLGDLRFSPGLKVGSDIAFTARLWCSGDPIAFASRRPGYLVHDDADDRVTLAAKPLAIEFEFMNYLDENGWLQAQSAAVRELWTLKLLRNHVFQAVANRTDPSWWDADSRQELAALSERSIAFFPDAIELLSRADRDALDAIFDPEREADAMISAVKARSQYRSLPAVLPRSLKKMFARQAPLRLLFSSAAVRYFSG